MPNRKPSGKRQNRSTRDLAIVPGGGATAPEPSKEWLAPVQRDWAEFWKSPLASIVQDTDIPALSRMFSLMDERERAYQSLRKGERMVKGSTGQPALNPLYKLLKQLDEEIRQLEDRFGLNPKTRHLLGISAIDMSRSLEDWNKSLAPDQDDSEIIEVEAEEDPRSA